VYNSIPLLKKAFTGMLVGMVALMVGCSSNQSAPPSVSQNYDYVIGPGDTLDIFVWGNPELSTSVKVRPDGKITTRLVEDLEASGVSSSQLARNIEKAYAKYVKTPIVTVIVDGFTGIPQQQVRVVGEAAKPLNVPFRKHMTLLDVMIEVGGLSEFASGNNAVLVRRDSGDGQSTFGLRLNDLLKSGDISANVPLLPGDIIIIPEAWF
jgi:polysaccharide export outer membrane protein